MLLKKVNTIIIVLVILCSTSFYSLSFLGPFIKGSELIGGLLIITFLILHIVYGNGINIKRNFYVPVLLILFSVILSMITARACRDQDVPNTLFAQRAMYYYLFYFLLHEMKPKTRDLEKLFLIFGIIHVIFYFIQFTIYPKIIFDVFILEQRGTIRIYLKGSDYLAISYFISIQRYFRTNRPKYLLLILLFFSIFVLLGGRQTMAIMAICLIAFLLIDKRVKSKLFNGILIVSIIFLVLIMFQNIFQELLLQSQKDTNLGKNYIRLLAVKYFLTDFFKCPIAYITGNGMYANHTLYGKEIESLSVYKRYFLGDIGLIGNYVIYGLLFVIGVLSICIKSFRIKIEKKYDYIKYMFLSIVLALLLGGGFASADFICAIMIALYILDVSATKLKTQ